MAELFDRIELTGLRRAHLDQLYSYLLQREEDGWYTGNREQFEKRHNELKDWLRTAVEYAYSESVVMPGDRKKKSIPRSRTVPRTEISTIRPERRGCHGRPRSGRRAGTRPC